MSAETSTRFQAARAALEAITQNIQLVMQPGQVHEMRVLGAMGRNRIDAGYFDDPVTAARAVLPYDGSSSGIYVTLNPVLPDLLARGSNRMVPFAKETTRDPEIIRRAWLLIDFDAVRPAGISSSNVEHQAALDRARAGRDWLRSENWPDPLVADSGNGAHLLYRVDLPNDAAARELLKACLAALKAELATDAVAIDTSVYNAGQLTKVYGTMACKGDNTAQRPHRRSQVLCVPAELLVVSRDQLEALASRDPQRATRIPTRAGKGNSTPPPASGGPVSNRSAYARKALDNELAMVQAATPGERNTQLNRSAYNLGQLVAAGVLEQQQVSSDLAEAAEASGLGRGEAEATIRSGLAAGLRSPRSLPEPQTAPTRSAAGVNATLAPKNSAGDRGGSEPSPANDSCLDQLRAPLHAVPLGDNGKQDRDQLETVALTLIEAATALTQADLLRLQSDLKQLGATAKFVDQFSRAVRDARQRSALGDGADDDLPKPDGWPYAFEHGQTFLLGVQTDTNGSRSIVRKGAIAEFQAQIVEEMISEDGQRSFVIAGNTSEGASFRLEINATEFADERALKAALTSAAGARAPIYAGMTRHVGPAIQLLSDPEIPTIRLFERTGWANGRFLIPGREREGQRIVLPSKLVYDLSGGDLALGLECLQQTFHAVQPEMLAPLLGFMLEAPLALLAGWREERYAAFIRGRSGTMKTTIGKHLMTIYGARFQEDGVLIKWGAGSTGNALMRLASHAHDIVLLVDNFKGSTGGGGKDLISFIHNALEGGDKDRLSRSAQLRETRPVYCWPLLTGEDIVGDPASLARTLVIGFGLHTVDPAHLAEAQSLALHLPAVGAAWITWLETEEGERFGQWARGQFPALRQKWSDHLFGIERDAINRLRVASNLASNQLTLQVASYHPVIGPVIKPYIGRHLDGLRLIAEAMTQSTSQGLEAQRFLATLRQLLASGRYLLLPKGAEAEQMNRDRVLGWEGPEGVYLLPDLARQAAERVLNDDIFNALSTAALYQQLDELGAIASSNAGRHTKQLRQAGVKVPTLHLKREALLGEGISDE